FPVKPLSDGISGFRRTASSAKPACRNRAGARADRSQHRGQRRRLPHRGERRRMKVITFAVLLLFGPMLWRDAAVAEAASRQTIVLASTTSVENSGLLANILPLFTKQTGI